MSARLALQDALIVNLKDTAFRLHQVISSSISTALPQDSLPPAPPSVLPANFLPKTASNATLASRCWAAVV